MCFGELDLVFSIINIFLGVNYSLIVAVVEFFEVRNLSETCHTFEIGLKINNAVDLSK